MKSTRVISRAVRLFSTLIAPALFCMQFRSYGIPVAAAVLLHEGGHLLVLWLVGGRVRRFLPSPFGLCITLDENTLSLASEAAVAAAGSAVNLLSALAVFLFVHPADGAWFGFFTVSLFLAAVNLLPLHPLDGGRLFELLLAACTDPLTAARGVRRIGLLFSYLLFLFSSYLLAVGEGGMYLLLLSLFFLAKNGEFERI
ncbi:MAG: site-2 protease family protein [Clostridia bacterium]|nr:site-2 protease family protein [Clostridia bacterium]